jgi:hypothetical protein
MPKKSPPRKGYKRSKLTKNPAYGAKLNTEFLVDMTGNVLVIEALRGSTFEERINIASMIPLFLSVLLSVLRGILKKDVDNATDEVSKEPKEEPQS